MINFWNNLPLFIKNKYFIITVLFTIWMLFFDQNDLVSQIKFKSELNKVENDKAFFVNEIKQTSEALNQLLTNDSQLETFAREHYYMKKKNEELFVIVAD